ncbi:MSMEG_0565 family glycosyltransferase [Dechloromonas hortensis]|uniref:MSMEG_0565 family glycosyltransferase n=1 Tax=Dechloromonas hortensis TaxID=337779 RepID=UPI001291CAE7|nr:MSMEG_0565 family glycosyltransferase [Dechloromonas hortensis]
MPITDKALRIALLTHSINPRGGVVHCLELADALVTLGHDVTVHAPARAGSRLFRSTRCQVRLIPDDVISKNLRTLVQRRIELFSRWFECPGHADFDIFHAHDGIGANALLTLQQAGRISGYLRTVHHLEDSYGDPLLDTLEERSIRQAGQLLSVSPTWAGKLAARFGREVPMVGNGVNLERFQPQATVADDLLRQRLGLGDGPVFLAVGGIEARKNTVATLRAFVRLRSSIPEAQLLIAGGASLLDHSDYQQQFLGEAATAGLQVKMLTALDRPPATGADIVIAGIIDDAEMPALYRLAHTLVFPSLVEGFGLAIIEAMASGQPVVVSDIKPFTDFLGRQDCLWVDPTDSEAIAYAMGRSLLPGLRRHLAVRGSEIARQHDWNFCAQNHLDAYRAFLASTSHFYPSQEYRYA